MYNFFASCDAAMPWQFGFQDPASPIISGIIHLHNNIILYLILIAFLVCWLLVRAVYLFEAEKNKIANKKFTHSTPLEIVWTITPVFLLLLLAGLEIVNFCAYEMIEFVQIGFMFTRSCLIFRGSVVQARTNPAVKEEATGKLSRLMQ